MNALMLGNSLVNSTGSAIGLTHAILFNGQAILFNGQPILFTD